MCEDDATQRKAVVQTIQNTVLIEELDMQLVLDTADPHELLEAVRTSQKTGIYFLDIDLKCDMNGMSFVRCHRSFLANKDNIKEVDTKDRVIYFVNGETCLMSTRMMKKI